MSSTYNPIRAQENKPRRSMFQRRDAPEPGVALVVHREGRPLILLRTTRDQLTAGEAWWGGIKTVYKVDTTDHGLEFSYELPCEGHAFNFGATLKLTCRVKDPLSSVATRTATLWLSPCPADPRSFAPCGPRAPCGSPRRRGATPGTCRPAGRSV
jgi:hypothetical protein